jgi:hypothetical protein
MPRSICGCLVRRLTNLQSDRRLTRRSIHRFTPRAQLSPGRRSDAELYYPGEFLVSLVLGNRLRTRPIQMGVVHSSPCGMALRRRFESAILALHARPNSHSFVAMEAWEAQQAGAGCANEPVWTRRGVSTCLPEPVPNEGRDNTVVNQNLREEPGGGGASTDRFLRERLWKYRSARSGQPSSTRLPASGLGLAQRRAESCGHLQPSPKGGLLCTARNAGHR